VELDGLNPVTQQTEARKRFGIVFQDPSLDDELTAWRTWIFTARSTTFPGASGASAPSNFSKCSSCGPPQRSRQAVFGRHAAASGDRAKFPAHAKIIFLDEPTLGLDPQTRNQLWTHVKKLNEDTR